MKRLRKTDNKRLFGVCGALGDYFDIDPVFFRIAFGVTALVYGTGLLFYLILAIVIPSRNPNEY